MVVQGAPAGGPEEDMSRVPGRSVGEEAVEHRLTKRGRGQPRHAQPSLELSEGELRVMHLLSSDLTRREIGKELYLSMNTVRTPAAAPQSISRQRSPIRKLCRRFTV